jgi:CRP/FNR family transcriptional regulator, cyclic AMP receptor protein
MPSQKTDAYAPAHATAGEAQAYAGVTSGTLLDVGVTAKTRADVCRVLEADSALAEAVPAEHRTRAIGECLARTTLIRPGRWQADVELLGEGIGLLVLRGLLIRRVDVEGRLGSELLGEGDLLRPWQEDEPPTLSVTSGWRVIEPTRIALLDERFAFRASRYPQLTGRLVGRAVQRSRHLVVNMAIVHQARVDVRLHMILWHLAGRWGRVRADGVSLMLRLTHNVLADLVAARRPTVTGALSELAKQGLVHSVEDGWLLTGPPPGELLKLEAIPSALAAATSSPDLSTQTKGLHADGPSA